jgi:hypothetical protein
MQNVVNGDAIDFEFLESLPTLEQGQAANIKIVTPYMKMGLMRLDLDDMREAFIEVYHQAKGCWLTVATITQLLVDDEWVNVPVRE